MIVIAEDLVDADALRAQRWGGLDASVAGRPGEVGIDNDAGAPWRLNEEGVLAEEREGQFALRHRKTHERQVHDASSGEHLLGRGRGD